MKRFFFLILFSFFALSNAQQSNNRFEEEGQSGFERPVVRDREDQIDDPQLGRSPGTPGELPVDDYIPFLIITAVGIIIYTTHKKRKLLTQK